jgi:hypothetical protein
VFGVGKGGGQIEFFFVHLRQILASHDDLARKLEALEKKYDAQLKIVFDAIRELMEPDEQKPKRKIAFSSRLKYTCYG